MAIDQAHPEYLLREEELKAIRDSLIGERAIKAEKETYLPAPPGMSNSGGDLLHSGKRVGNGRYSFYLTFAEFPELISPVLNGFQGIIHENDPLIELPDKMQYLLDDATPDGSSLLTVWRRVTREVLSGSRIGILNDIGSDDKIRMVGYTAENVRNWQLRNRRDGGGPEMVVLREFSEEPKEDDRFTMETKTRYRLLELHEEQYRTSLWEQVSDVNSGQNKTFTQVADSEVEPALMGERFSEIPITIINTVDTGFQYEPMPLMPLTRRCLSIYRLTADYRRSLYIKGDPQIVISGITKEQAPTEIGGESIWTLPNPNAKATYLDIDGQGIPLMKEAINDEYERFYQEGGKLLDTADRGAESGEALRRRQVAQQVSLRDIAGNCGEAFEMVLRKIAVMFKEDPKKVKFTPDLDFAEPTISGRDLLEIMTAKTLGAPLSDQSIHELAHKGGLTNMTYDLEKEKLGTEVPLVLPVDADPKIDEPEIEDPDDDK